MNLKQFSLQARLTLLVLATMLLYGLIAGYASYKSALNESDEIFDAQLAQFAQNLIVISAYTDGDADHEQIEPLLPAAHKYQQKLVFQVWNTNNIDPRLLLCSNNISHMTFAQIPGEGYSNGDWQGEHWRYYRQRDVQRGFDVLVGQNDQARNQMAQEVAWHNIVPILLGLPLLGIFSILAIRFSLRPLFELTESLLQLSPLRLQPLTLQDVPQEIAPVIKALNSLLSRISKTMENERRFTADASHELRTPLAALQAQVQAAQLSSNEIERKECLSKAVLGAERMNHLIGQLLTLSRLDELSTPVNPQSVSLSKITQECCAESGEYALSKNIDISFFQNKNCSFFGYEDMLHILLRNLLDNAIRYTPSGGRVEVRLLVAENHQVELEISDSGVGVAVEQLALLGQRFNRINKNVAEGVGLGLSIVQRIVEIHHAEITFSRSSVLGGLSVKVHFSLP